jgi:hypothetical protein
LPSKINRVRVHGRGILSAAMVGGWPGGIWLLSDEFYSGNYHWIGIQESFS